MLVSSSAYFFSVSSSFLKSATIPESLRATVGAFECDELVSGSFSIPAGLEDDFGLFAMIEVSATWSTSASGVETVD